MMRQRWFLYFALWILILPVCSFAQTSDDLFSGDALQEIRIYVNPLDWAALKQNFLADTYYAIEFHWIFNARDITLPQVAARSRGQGSRSGIKPSLKVEFDRYESHQNFLGLQNLVLRADTQDASMMHERVAMEFFRLLGLAAPRETHTRLYVNDAYAGLYTVVEPIDPVFLKTNFGEDGGYLYNYQWADAFLFEYRGPNPSTYSPVPFQPENNFLKPDAASLEAMVRTVNQTPDDHFEATVSQYIDLNAFVKEIAAENFLADQDGIVGDYGLNNFYLYRFQNTFQSIFLPWDKSNAFWSLDWPIMHNVETDVLSRRALAVPGLLATYRDTLGRAADLAGGHNGWLEQEIIKEYQQIRQAAYEDPFKLCDPGATGYLRPCSNEMFDAEVQQMIEFAELRPDFVRTQLN